jgi:hypothetical protein
MLRQITLTFHIGRPDSDKAGIMLSTPQPQLRRAYSSIYGGATRHRGRIFSCDGKSYKLTCGEILIQMGFIPLF